MKRTFAIGDIHGMYDELLSVLRQANFDYENDVLICLGDIVDRGYNSYGCIEELMKIKNLINVRGNHDDWFTKFLNTGKHPVDFLMGGYETLYSYPDRNNLPQSHRDFFNKQLTHFIDEKNRLFIHAGFNLNSSFEDQDQTNYYWSSDLYDSALRSHKSGKPFIEPNGFKEIFMGHTQTLRDGTNQPIQIFNIINLDTGAYAYDKGGKLTLMDINTKQYWQSGKI